MRLMISCLQIQNYHSEVDCYMILKNLYSTIGFDFSDQSDVQTLIPMTSIHLRVCDTTVDCKVFMVQALKLRTNPMQLYLIFDILHLEPQSYRMTSIIHSNLL